MTTGLAACLDSWLLARHWTKLNVSTINSPTNSMRLLMLRNDLVPCSTLSNWLLSSFLTISPGRSLFLPRCRSLSRSLAHSTRTPTLNGPFSLDACTAATLQTLLQKHSKPDLTVVQQRAGVVTELTGVERRIKTGIILARGVGG